MDLTTYESLKGLCRSYGLILMWEDASSQWLIGRRRGADDISYERILSLSAIALSTTPWGVIEKRITSAVINYCFEGSE